MRPRPLIIRGSKKDGQPDWPVPERLTIFEAAMVYIGRHPHHPFSGTIPARDAGEDERADHLMFYGLAPNTPQNRSGGRALVARDVYFELIRRVKAGTLSEGIVRADLGDGSPDPLHTLVPLSELLDIARCRRDAWAPLQRRAEVATATKEDARHAQIAPGQAMPRQQTPRCEPWAVSGRLLRNWVADPHVEAEAGRRTRRENETALSEAMAQMARECGQRWTAGSIATTRRRLRAEELASVRNLRAVRETTAS